MPRKYILRNPRKPKPLADRFWPKVKVGAPDECWEWQAVLRHHRRPLPAGSVVKGQYGQFRVTSQYSTAAHRMAWQLANGPIPDGKLVCHTCDNRKCCNPAHLFLGTLSDNMRDCSAKGRCRNQFTT